ncbi:MAG: hypothetical protein P4L36_11700 [Holophaga sp.]|nr:hypothetical protein [Holophaga sp.]
MHRTILATSLIACALVPVQAGGVFQNSNQSAEYIRTFDRNSAVDNADIVYYNMAGTPRLRPGWTFNVSNQTLFQKATVATGGNPVLGDRQYRSDNPIWFLPSVYAAYRKDAWAAFAALQAIGATAVRSWTGGLPTLDLMGKRMAGYGSPGNGAIIAGDAYGRAIQSGMTPAQARQAAAAAGLSSQYYPSDSFVKGSSHYLALRGGGALQVSPRLSVAGALRLVAAELHTVAWVNGSCSYDQDGADLTTRQHAAGDALDKAVGMSGEFGFNFAPDPRTVVSFTYEMGTRLDFRRSVKNGASLNGTFVDGQHHRLDLPQVVRIGLGCQAAPALRVSFGFNDYLESRADFAMLDDPAFAIHAAGSYRNTVEEQASVEYRLNSRWLVSFGLNLNQIGQTRAATLDTALPGAHADYLSEGVGFEYSVSDRTRLNFAVGHTAFLHPYRNADAGDRQIQAAYAAQGVSVNPAKEYNKEYVIVAIGIDFHL